MEKFVSQDRKSYLEYQKACRDSFSPNWMPPNGSWPLEKMADWGMRYKEGPDKVQCDYCLVITFDWIEGDDPKEGHLRECPFMRWYAGRPLILGAIGSDEQTPMEDETPQHHPLPTTHLLTVLEQRRAQEMEDAELHDEWVRCRKCVSRACMEDRGLLFLPCTHLIYCRPHGEQRGVCDHPEGASQQCCTEIRQKIPTRF